MNIKKLVLLSLLSSLMFIQCNKSTKKMTTSVDKVVQEVEDLSWRSAAPQAGEARPIKIGDYQTFQLENGLTVIVVENHKLPRVSYQLSLKHKQISENEMVGMVDFAGQLMSRGTKTRSKADIDGAVDYIGANFNTWGYGMFGSSLKKHSGKLLNVMTDVLYNPTFPEEEFEKIKKQTISGLESSKTDPNQMVSNVAAVLNYGKDHPYGEIQTFDAVDQITVDACKSYYNTFFKPNNAYLVVVGDLSLEEAKTIVDENFGSWKKGVVPVIDHEMPKAPESTEVSVVNKDGAVQSVINVTYPIDLKPGGPDAIKASVMNSILGGGIFSGRLMQNLREDKAYTYGARSSTRADRLVGNFNAFASVRNEVTDSSVNEFLYEMRRMTTEAVSEEDLQLTKNSLAGNFARSLESPQTIARFALNTYRYNLPKDYYNTYLQKLDQVTIADVTEMSMKYIRPDRANIVIAGNKDDISEKLLRFDSDGKIDYYDAFGNEVKNDIALPEGLTAQNIIDDYIAATGGRDKLMSIKTMTSKSEMEMMGQVAEIEVNMKEGNKYAMKMSMMGNVMQEQKFDGTKGYMGGMGQSKTITEGPELEQLKGESEMFKQLNYASNGTTLELKGVENVDGTDCYKVAVKSKSGKETTQFYDIKTNYLIREVSSQDGPQGPMNITTDLADYSETNGISSPQTIKITGAAPFPLVMKVKEVIYNAAMDDSIFSIN